MQVPSLISRTGSHEVPDRQAQVRRAQASCSRTPPATAQRGLDESDFQSLSHTSGLRALDRSVNMGWFEAYEILVVSAPVEI